MSRCEFSPRARRDLHEIRDYIARDSPRAAAEFTDFLEERCRSLAKFPEMGQRCEQLTQALRCFTAGNYVIFYRPIDDGIEVVRVVSGARDIRSLFEPDS